MKKKLLILMLVMATALVCSVKETFAFSPAVEPVNEVSEPVVVNSFGNLKPLALSNKTFEKGTKLYFGGEDLEEAEAWLSEHYTLPNSYEIPMFQYDTNYKWYILYNGATKTIRFLSRNEADPLYGDIQDLFLETDITTNATSRDYVELTVNYVSSDNYCHLVFIEDSTNDELYNIQNYLYNCFYVATSEPEIIYQSNNYFNGVYNEVNGTKTSNLIPVIESIDSNPTKVYIQTNFNCDDLVKPNNKNVIFHLYSKDFNYLGSIEPENLHYNTVMVEQSQNVGFKYMVSSDFFTDYNASYYSIEVSYNYNVSNDSTIFTLNTEDLESMTVNYLTTNQNKAFSDIDIIEPNEEKINTGITWNSGASTISNGSINLRARESITLQEILNTISAKNSNGDKLEVAYYSRNESETFVSGNNYLYILIAEDNGVEDIVILNIEIIDSVAPQIYGSNNYTVGTNATLSINTIKNSLVVVDNIDEVVEIKVLNDYYTANAKTPGTYTVTFSATDSSNNMTEFIVTIKVVDKEKPVYYNNYGQPVTSMTVYKSVDSVFVLKEITDLITAKDTIDGVLEMSVAKDDYTGKGDQNGSYSVILLVRDKAGNNAYFTINIIVTSVMPSKSLLIDGRIFVVENTEKLTTDDFRNVMKISGLFNTTTISYVKVDSVAYEENYSQIGEYAVGYEIRTTSGEYDEGAYVVRVVESRSADSFTETPEEKPGIIKRIFGWLWDLIVSLFNWIIGLFK